MPHVFTLEGVARSPLPQIWSTEAEVDLKQRLQQLPFLQNRFGLGSPPCGHCMMGLDQYHLQGSTEDLFSQLERTAVGKAVLLLQFLRPLGAVVAGIHGYYRHDGNWGATAGWAALGFLFPVFTPLASVIQGYGQSKDSQGDVDA